MGLTIVPVTFRAACDFIAEHHRHHRPPRGMKFAVGVHDGVRVVGVATVGRPVARNLDNGQTVEVTRTCTDGTANANSKLYGAAWRTARGLGYRRLVTFTQSGETGSSLRAAGLIPVAYLRPRSGWDTKSRPRSETGVDHVARIRWEIRVGGATAVAHRLVDCVPPTDLLRSSCVPAVSAGTAGDSGTGSGALASVHAPRSTAIDAALLEARSRKEEKSMEPIPVPEHRLGDARGGLGEASHTELAEAVRELAAAVRDRAAQMPRDSDALLTAEQVGELFALSPRTLKDQASAGVFPHRRFGKHYRFSREDVAEIVRLARHAPREIPGWRAA